MKPTRLLVTAVLAATIAGCGDSPRSTLAPMEPSFNSANDCLVAEVQMNPTDASVAQGSNAAFTAVAIGKLRGSNTLCNFTLNNVVFTWSVSNQSLAQVGQTSSHLGNGSANIYGAAAGTVQVTVSATTSGISSPTTATKSTNLTIVAISPAPTVGTITGPATAGVTGSYNFSVTATGGSGTHSYEWQLSSNGGTTWSAAHSQTGGATVTAPIWLQAGALYQLRVRARYGNSPWSGWSASKTVDARNALTVSLSGSDNLRERGEHGWEAMPTGGDGTYTYSWRMEREDGSEITGYTGKTFSWWFDSCDEEPDGSYVEVTVTSGGQSTTAALSLNVETYLRSPCD